MTLAKRMSFTVLVVFLFAAWTQTTALAGPFEDGMAAYDHEDYQSALNLWQPLADQGDAAAQAWVGMLYRAGRGVEKDYAEAAKWFQRAAEQGHADAQLYLGQLYGVGLGVKMDGAEAVKWFQKAADQGQGFAQAALGRHYASGLEVEKDYIQAYMWFSLANSSLADLATREDNAKDLAELAIQMTPEQIEEAKRLAAAWKPTPTAKPNQVPYARYGESDK